MKTMRIVLALLLFSGSACLIGCGSSTTDTTPRAVGGNVNPKLKGPVSRGGPVGGGGIATGGGATAKGGLSKK